MRNPDSLDATAIFPDKGESSLELVCDDNPASRRFDLRGFTLGALGRVLASWRSEITALSTIREISERMFPAGRHAGCRDCLTFSHLDEAQLLAHLDGELPADVQDHVTSHLQSCWTCRSRLRALRVHIEAFLAEREIRIPDLFSASEQRICELRRRLTQVVENASTE
jgi:hypothetical protein